MNATIRQHRALAAGHRKAAQYQQVQDTAGQCRAVEREWARTPVEVEIEVEGPSQMEMSAQTIRQQTILSRVEHNWSRKGIAGHETYSDGSERYIRQLDALICTLGITVSGVVVAALAWWPV